jgi:serine/threonine-protein kinase
MGRWERRVIETYRNASDRQRAAIISATGLVLISLVVLTVILASRPTAKVAQVASAERATTEQLTPGQAPSPAAPEQKGSASEKPTKKAVPEKKVQGVKESSRVRTLAETTGAPAVVSLVVQPWGEIYLDGRMQGISPPLLELQVVAGKHEIKIRNTKFPAYTQVIRVKSGEKIKIRHTFAN